ncbi:TetR/AcrR family transcriptional regulator C-terminal domain-containing protein [Nocardioides solisilvae]|uniref:TetR/AcrR family transcriptional regulator C-terminal domain-containing protein n=1 Tax=Nocardioides solisilvae TaxID=1542435 RepID=UPI000D747600|nr:TetR/AcrR family transcriptional regulator C-terminal domain-containing protein [Nocardioides solisilvae]
MGYRREDVVERAIEVLDRYGLPDLTMRRLGQELGVRPSALYHHFANKQTLLAAVADELLARGLSAAPDGPWDERVATAARRLRDSLLAWRDGAELVATVHAFGLGADAAPASLAGELAGSGLDEELVRTATRTLLHLVLGHAAEEQTRLQAASAGAIDAEPEQGSDFEECLRLVLDGIRVRAGDRVVRS